MRVLSLIASATEGNWVPELIEMAGAVLIYLVYLANTLPGWDNLSMVKKNQVYVTDGNQYFNRPGSRLVANLEILIEILYEGLFNFGYYGSGWVRLKYI